ncbi:hypothetical protein [Lentilactobacillus hilgardii]|uniref:hypothetical protein n=1 Tax=Lentilactobacillus hilgardii TaxID=1588 RepID=UPI001CC1D279|nr:hypothetical protein [Lentilactobacillus hilgardii]
MVKAPLTSTITNTPGLVAKATSAPHDYENKGLAKPKLNRTAYRKLQHFTVNPYNYYHDQDHQLKLIYQIYRHQTHKRVHQLSE